MTLGIKPNHAATGYGYIRPGAAIERDVLKLEQFVEKPDRATAQRYMDEGYLWNSGNFFFRADVMQGELLAFEPALITAASDAVAKARQDLDFTLLDAESFSHATKKSIDYAVMERTSKAAVVPADIGWSDVGNWAAVWELSDQDADGNSIRGNGAIVQAKNVHVRSPDHLTAVVGVDDVIVVTTHDAVLWWAASTATRSSSSSRSCGARGAARRWSTSARTGRGATTSRSTRARATRSSASW